MKQIARLELKNFTSYESLDMEFDTITCIKGANGQGKSNILLALYVILFNDDFVEGLIKRGEKEAWIRVTFTDGSNIYRKRTKKGQEITLTYADGTHKTYTSTKCTDQVQEFTGFVPVKLDLNSPPENLQYVPPKSPHFLMNKSPEVTMRCLSALISGQGVETAKALIQKDLSENKALITQSEADLFIRVSNLSLLTGSLVDSFYDRAEQAQSRQCELDEKQLLLESLVSYRTIQKEKALSDDEESFIAEAYDALDDLEVRLTKLGNTQDDVDWLRGMKQAVADITVDLIHDSLSIDQVEKEMTEVREQMENHKCLKCGKFVMECAVC